MNAKPASPLGLLAMVPEGGVVPVVPHEVLLFAPVQLTEGSARRGIGAQVRAAAKPCAVDQDVRIRQRRRTAARDVAERSSLERLVVVLAPFVIVDRRRDAPVL